MYGTTNITTGRKPPTCHQLPQSHRHARKTSPLIPHHQHQTHRSTPLHWMRRLLALCSIPRCLSWFRRIRRQSQFHTHIMCWTRTGTRICGTFAIKKCNQYSRSRSTKMGTIRMQRFHSFG